MTDSQPRAAQELDAEDAKLVTLARGARARAGAAEGAAVRDDDGRTYAAATVVLPSLTLTALQAAVAAAVASGAQELEAAVVVGAAVEIDPASAAAAGDLGATTLILAGPDGVVRSRS
jgi:cytidine deaminase